MWYIDTGSRNPAHAVGTWLKSLCDQDISYFRFQSGYFSSEGLAPLMPLLQSLTEHDMAIRCVLGSNGGDTAQPDLENLADLIGWPRRDANIAVVSYSTGLYHPKVYHAVRTDGTQTAYVGSANLTSSGVSGLNVEAGIILDTAKGDSGRILAEIASAVDVWFDESTGGAHIVSKPSDIAALAAVGILRRTRSSRIRPPVVAQGATAGLLVGLVPLVRFPPVGTGGMVSVPNPQIAPSYVLLDPNATDPTRGPNALTGSPLPGGAIGLIALLNRDSARHFEGRGGTANVSIPVATLSTMRFGIFQGRFERPRCEFPMLLRYADDRGLHCEQLVETNVMVYGHAPGETGHGDVRMVLPKRPVTAIRDFAEQHRSHIPTTGDPMILEWPTPADPSFKLTRLPQLGGREDANSLNSLDRPSEGRHYTGPNGEAAPLVVRRRSAAQAVAAGSCRAGAAVAGAPCSVECGAAARGAGRRWWADGRPPSGWWRRPRGWRAG